MFLHFEKKLIASIFHSHFHIGKKHRLNDKDSKLFWDRIESQLTLDAEIETKEKEMRLAEVCNIFCYLIYIHNS